MMSRQFFKDGQQVTPTINKGRIAEEKMFGKVFTVEASVVRYSRWWIRLVEKPIGPCPCGCGRNRVIDNWAQEDFAPVGSNELLETLLIQVFSANMDKPIIVCPNKIGGLGL